MTSAGGARDCGWRSVFLARRLSSNQKWLCNPFSSTRTPFKHRDRNYAMTPLHLPPPLLGCRPASATTPPPASPPQTGTPPHTPVLHRLLAPLPSPTLDHSSRNEPGVKHNPCNFAARRQELHERGRQVPGRFALLLGSEPQATRCLR